MKMFCQDLLQHATKIISNEEKEIILLTYKENNFYKNQKVCYICKKRFRTNDDNKEYHKVKDHCYFTGKYRGAAHNFSNYNIKYQKKILVVLHNGSNYDYHFIIKELAKESEGQFKCLGENTENYITFSVPIKEEFDISKKTTYKLRFIDSFTFMSTSLSSLVDNLYQRVHSDICTDCKSCLEHISAKDNQLVFKCLKCNNNHNKDIIDLQAHINFVMEILMYLFCC